MQRAQNSTSTSPDATVVEGQEIAPKRAYDRSAYKLFPDPPNAIVHTTPPTRSSPPATRPIVNRARRSVSLNEFSKSSMQPVSRSNQGAGSGAGWNGASPKEAEDKPGAQEQAETGVNGMTTTSEAQQHQASSSSSPHDSGRERPTSLPDAQKPMSNGPQRSPPLTNTRVSPPPQRYYANLQQSGDMAGAAPAQFESRVAQVQKLLAAGIKPPPLVTEFSGRQRSSSGSGRDPVGLGLSFGSNATTPDLAMFPAPGKPGAFISRPQSPGSYVSSGPRSSHDGVRSRPQSPNAYGMPPRPQSPAMNPHSRPQSPSRMTPARPQSPFAQPPPRPHSPNGYQPRQGSPLSGNSSRPQSPRSQHRPASPMHQPGRPGQPRMAPHDLRVDTSMSAQRPVRPSADHRQMYQHQRQNTEYRQQMQGVRPLPDDSVSIPDVPQQSNERRSPPQIHQPDQHDRASPSKPQQTPPQLQETVVSEPTGLKPPTDERQKRKMVRKSRLQKPLPPPPPPDALLPPGPTLDPTSDTSRESSRPDSPVSTTSSTSPVSPVSPMFSQGYGYSTVAANAPSLPSPVSAIANFDITLPSDDAPDIPPLPTAFSKEHLPVKSAETTRPPSPIPHSPPLSPPSSKFQVQLNSQKTVVSPRRSPSPAETPSPKSTTSSDGPHRSDSPVHLEKASSMQIQPLEMPNFDGSPRDSSRVSSVKSGHEGAQQFSFGHQRVLSLAPSLIEVRPLSEQKRRELNEKEKPSEPPSTTVQTSNIVPADEMAPQKPAEPVSSKTQDTVPATLPEAAITKPNLTPAPAELTQHPVKDEVAKPDAAPATSTTTNLRTKSSKAKDLISKIEQKVQSDTARLGIGSSGRNTPNERSPTPSIKSQKPSPNASRENLVIPRKQVASASQTPQVQDEIAPSPLVITKSHSNAPSPDVSGQAKTNSPPPVQQVEGVKSTTSKAATVDPSPPLQTDSKTVTNMKTSPGVVQSTQSALPTTNEQTASTAAAKAVTDTAPSVKSMGQGTDTAKPLTSAARLFAAAQQHMKAVQALGQHHEPLTKKASPENVISPAAKPMTDESAKASSDVPSKAEASRDVAHKDRPVAAAVVAKPVKISDVATSPHSKSDSMSSYKSFFMQEDIFFSDSEAPTHGTGALPSIKEDGVQEEPEGRKSTSTMQSVPSKIPARQMVRDDRPASKTKAVQSSSSSILSSHWSRYDEVSPGSSSLDLPGPHIAPFARADRPSSTDTGVLPANENIKISPMPYESQRSSENPSESTKLPTQDSTSSHQRSDSITRAQPGEVERLDVVRPNTAPQPRPVSAAPPPVPRKDTIRRPIPKRAPKSDTSKSGTAKPANVAEKQREHIAADLARNESQGSVSSISLDAIRARVAGLSERTARAIEAPSKDDISLLSTLEDLAKQSEALHERYAILRGDRQKLTNNMTAFLRDARPGPGYIATLMDQNAALAAVMSSMDICFAKLKSLDCRKEEAIAGLMANVHREPSIASGRARGMSTSQLKQTLLLSREPSNATVVSELVKDKSNLKSTQPAQHKQSAQQTPQLSSTTPNPSSASTTPRPQQGPIDSQTKQETPTQPQNAKQSPQRPRVQGLKAAKVLGLMNKQGQATEKDITLPSSNDKHDESSRLVVNLPQLRQAKTPPPQRPLPTPPARSTSAVNSMHASVMSVASTPEDPDLWTPHEEDDEVTPNVLKGPAAPGRDVRVYAEDDFLEYYRNAR